MDVDIQKNQCFFFSVFFLFACEPAFSNSYVEFGKHSILDQVLSACFQFFYNIGAGHFYSTPVYGWRYVGEGSPISDPLGEGGLFFRFKGEHWCTGRSRRYFLDDYFTRVTTYFVHDDTGLELLRTEAVGTPQERTISTEWNDTLRLPVKVTTPTSVTQFTYDEQGNRLSRTRSPR